ncbi:MAG: M20/M25/M40 family metallo-hydrolase [Actinomycetota bacterium]
MINTSRLVKTFSELIKVDSLTFYEERVAEYIANKLGELDIDVCIDDAGERVGGDTGNVIAHLPGNTSAPTLLFNAHLDTVEPGIGIEPQIKDGIIRSKGDTILGADDKAGVAIILEMLYVLKASGLPHGDIEVVFTIAEEKGLFGSKNLDLSRFKAKFGYILDCEGPPGRIVTRAPFQDSIKALFKGKSAHAGICPERGINAIQAAAIAISRMNLGRIDDETTANIGVIKGGLAANIVPEETSIEGEARSLSLQKLEAQVRHMESCLTEGGKTVGAKLDLEVSRVYDGFTLSSEDEVVKIAMDAARAVGIEPKLIATGGGSDANVFNKAGISTVNLSVGAVNVHSTNEQIAIADLEVVANMTLEIVRLVSRGSS